MHTSRNTSVFGLGRIRYLARATMSVTHIRHLLTSFGIMTHAVFAQCLHANIADDLADLLFTSPNNKAMLYGPLAQD